MQHDLKQGYISSCIECQQNKSSTIKPARLLHPLPVPDGQCDSVAIDFVGLLPEDENKNCIVSMTDHLHSDVHIIATQTDIDAKSLACLFFDYWYCENGLLLHIISDHDKLFLFAFWKALHQLTGVMEQPLSLSSYLFDLINYASLILLNKLSILFHPIIVWPCGRYYKVQGWAHV